MAPWWTRRFESKTKQKADSCTSSSHDLNLTFHDKYYVGSKLGKGSFGQVYVAQRSGRICGDITQSNPLGEEFRAVKIMDMRNVKGNRHQKALQNEISIWAKLKNQQHCVHLYEVFEEDGLTYMVMEKCDLSLLAHFHSFGEGLDERSLGEVFAQMATGMKNLHALKIVHRDIKPDNFFVGGSNGTTVKLGDYGLAVLTTDEPDGKPIGECGTAPYMSPEMVAREAYNEKSDVWSFGVLVYVLLFGSFPYTPTRETVHDMKMSILNDVNGPDFASDIPLTASAISFSMKLLDRDPTSRPSSADVLNMAYMTAVITSSDEFGKNLPSLRPTLRLAVKCQAFEYRILARDGLDVFLDMRQIEKLGTPMSETHRRAPHSWDPSMFASASLTRNKPYCSSPRRACRTSSSSKSIGTDVQRPLNSSTTNERSCICEV